MPELVFSGITLVVVLILISVFFTFFPLGLWISAIAAGVKVSIFTLVGMRLRRVIPSRVINPMIKAHKAGLDVSINQLESHYLAGGNVDRVINALIAAHPKVIETPYIAGVAINGIEVKAKARITVRANIERLVGGAGEETVIARVGEGIVSTIGSSESHTVVLENPDRISKTILDKGLDAGTAFEILSIDILDVDIGQNIGANLQTEQAIADKNIAQAKAEQRRAMAVAAEQEMKARIQEMRAKVVEAEAELPLAMAKAFQDGNLGVMDYMNYKNLEADTGMRDSIKRMSQPEAGENK